jgi:hypothetical protein
MQIWRIKKSSFLVSIETNNQKAYLKLFKKMCQYWSHYLFIEIKNIYKYLTVIAWFIYFKSYKLKLRLKISGIETYRLTLNWINYEVFFENLFFNY